MLKKIVVLLSLVLAGAAYGQTPEEMLRQAEQLETEGKLQRAIEVYETFVRKFSDHSQVDHANWRLAKCFDDQGLPEKAEAQLRKLVGNGKKNFRNRADAFYMLGKMQAADKKYAEAVVTFEKMLAEGAGLHEEEVLNLTGGYYAILGKFDEAAGKFNILRLRRDNAKAAEAASYKLVKLWLQAEKLDQAREAIKDLDQAFPDSKQLPELLFRLADGYRLKQKFDMTIGLCEQIRTRYPKSVEAIAGGYLLGLCYRDRGEHQKAVQALEQVGRVQDAAARPLAAEAMLAAAEIYLANLNDTPKAMGRYEEAASIARQTESERRSKILEQCYFRLGEYHFREKRYSVAREYYLLIRAQGSEINVLPRILECDGQLKKTDVSDSITTIDAEFLKKRVTENPGTFTALEAEVLLADRKLAEVLRGRGVAVGVAADFEKLLSSYKKDVLAQDNVEAYIYSQIGACYATGASKEELAKAMAAYEKLIASDPTDKNIYLIPALEAMAITADRAGDKARAAKARQDLFNHSKAKLDANKEDKGLEKKTLEYLKTLATHSEGDMVDQSIALCKKIIEEKGALSELSREARFNMAELYYLKKDYSNAARVYKEFVSIHGPKQDANGEVENAPWKPASGGIEVDQIFDAAIRVAHCWYMQHNDLDLKAQYEWIVRNFPLGNKYAVEAYYYLALEKAKGKEGQKKENKRAMADELWTKVVNPSQAFESADFKKSFYPWVGLPVDDPSNAGQYVRTAILRAGQAYSEIAEHELAARMFEQFLTLFGGGLERSGKGQQPGVSGDEMSDMARYALGREYIALNRISRMLEVYKPYLGGLRDSRFRISALKLMGYHAGKLKMYEAALNAYATLLDEYGEPLRNAQGDAIPVPANQRLRDNAPGWNGIRTPVPKELNLGEIRYALGFLYWKQENYRRCALALQPFAQDAALANNAHRPTAMFMAAQSYYKLYDYAQGVPLLQTLIREVPKFEAIEEIYELAARGLVALRQWNEVELLYKRFVAAWPNSGRRARLDLYNAASLLAGGNTAKGLAELRGLINGEYDQATKADALYYTARNNKNDKEAMQQFEQSLRYYAREASCLAAAQCAVRLGDLKRAQELLDRTIRDFPQGEPAVIAEARETLPKVLKELAQKSK